MSHALTKRFQLTPETRQLVIAISSPPGSTGKTTLATNLAVELSKHGKTILIDLDSEAPAAALQLGLTELGPGLDASMRIANQDRFDKSQLERVLTDLPNSTAKLLTGAQNRERFTELTEAGLQRIITTAKSEFDFIVLDCPAMSSSGQAPFWLASAAEADRLWLVILADPVGIYRALSLEKSLKTLPNNTKFVINRLRNSVISQARREIEQTISGMSAISIAGVIPEDSVHLDQAMKQGQVLAASARSSPFRQALTSLIAAELVRPKSTLGRMAKLG